jgi:hypothetical protein
MPISLAIILGENKTIRQFAGSPTWSCNSTLAFSTKHLLFPANQIQSFCMASDKLQSLAEGRIRGIREKHSWPRESSADGIRANNVAPAAFNATVFSAEDVC